MIAISFEFASEFEKFNLSKKREFYLVSHFESVSDNDILVCKSSELLNKLDVNTIFCCDQKISQLSEQGKFFQKFERFDHVLIENLLSIYKLLKKKSKPIHSSNSGEHELLAELSSNLKYLKVLEKNLKRKYDQIIQRKTLETQYLKLVNITKIGKSSGIEYSSITQKNDTFHLDIISSQSYEASELWFEYLTHKFKEKIYLEHFNIHEQRKLKTSFLKGECRANDILLNYFGEISILSNLVSSQVKDLNYSDVWINKRKVLRRNERCLIFSSNAYKCFQGSREELQELCHDALVSRNSEDILEKIILELSSNGEYGILKHDISLTLLEAS